MANGTRSEADLARAVVESLIAIERLPAKSRMFVKVERVRRRRSMDPTPFQQDLYNWIRKRGFVEWSLTLGMHWGMLGGLMARGLVVEDHRNGVRGIVAK